MTTNGADIQIENGNFTRLHNAILEKLAGAGMGKYEFRCVLYLLRMTYGYRCKEAPISIDEWVGATGLDRGNVGRALRNLIGWHVILKTETGNGRGHKSTYGFNKYHEQWCIATNSVTGDTLSESTNSVTGDTLSDDKQCQNSPINSVKTAPSTTSAKERKKAAAAAANFSTPALPAAYAPFVETLIHVWGPNDLTPREQKRIADWAGRVTSDAWRYALQEAADNGHRGHWKYATAILERVERDGFNPPIPTQPALVADFALEDVL